MAPVLQRQFKEGAERDSRSGLEMVSRNRTSLKCTFFYSFEGFLVEKIIHIENYRDVIG